VLVGRTPAKLATVADRVAAVTGTAPRTFQADFALLADVRRLAGELLAQYERIDVLVNHAGVMTTRRERTADGHELMMQVNHLAPFLLTNLLLDRLKESSARIVTTSSRAARTGRLDPADLSRDRRRWSGWLQYGDTKQANALFTVALADRGLAATSLHPGVLNTGFAAGTLVMKFLTVVPGMAEPPDAGASRIVHLVTHPDGVDHSGRFFIKNVPAAVPRTMTDPELVEALWSASQTACPLRPPGTPP
jgi:NAD(P)-dependent dehydrogenase (short-subunit alcohol dehydrogenase family)